MQLCSHRERDHRHPDKRPLGPYFHKPGGIVPRSVSWLTLLLYVQALPPHGLQKRQRPVVLWIFLPWVYHPLPPGFLSTFPRNPSKAYPGSCPHPFQPGVDPQETSAEPGMENSRILVELLHCKGFQPVDTQNCQQAHRSPRLQLFQKYRQASAWQ